MPRNNRFRHQSYPTQPTTRPTRHVLQSFPEGEDFARLHTVHQVREVVLVPGTFAGDDPFHVGGILRAAGDRLPAMKLVFHQLADRLAEKSREVLERVAEDVGNYTQASVECFERLVGGDPLVRLMDPIWSGQNHHFARADLAVRLLADLDTRELYGDEQILLWGHSHAGNGFALLSNLLANHRESVQQFFEACGQPEQEHWQRAWQTLQHHRSPHPLAKHISVVTFGTPVRYGWDTDGLNRIFHILSDRNAPDPEMFTTRPLFPPHPLPDVLQATYGDWVQVFGIAGTDVPPLTPSLVQAQKQLSQLFDQDGSTPELTTDLQLLPGSHLKEVCARWKTGTRCHADGDNLLVEYRPCGRQVLGQPVEEALFGHGVATTLDWLPAHLSLILNRLDQRAGVG